MEKMKLKIPHIDFDSSLADLIVDLEKIRDKQLQGTTHPTVFYQLQRLFHNLESVGSARIEGNNTTISDYIDTRIENPDGLPDSREEIQEILNVNKAAEYVEQNIASAPVDRLFLSDLHKLVVQNLPVGRGHEGDMTPGVYRTSNIRISGSDHTPPDYTTLQDYMDELFEFINTDVPSKYDLVKAAVVHHRFVWIHPFNNGNGRTVRLLTYAMILKAVVHNTQRIVNPTAVFCADRKQYYHYLSLADSGTDEGVSAWCEYMLSGLKSEFEKIDRLLDYEYLRSEILVPAIQYTLSQRYISEIDAKILLVAVNSRSQEIQNGDLRDIFKNKQTSEISRQLKRMCDNRLLRYSHESRRKYVVCFVDNYLTRGVIRILDSKGFLPANQ